MNTTNQAESRTEIVVMRRSSRMANGRYKPAYYNVYQNGELKGQFATRQSAQRLADSLKS